MGHSDIVDIPEGTKPLLDAVHSAEKSAVDLYTKHTVNGPFEDPRNAESLRLFVQEMANLLIVTSKDYDGESAYKIASLVIDVVYGDINQIHQHDATIVSRRLSAELLSRIKVFESRDKQPKSVEHTVENLAAMFGSNYRQAIG